MANENASDVAIVGGGIAGLAHAYMCLRKGYKVVLFERDPMAVSASVRNFGLIWPIGQLPGEGFNLALRSRLHWMEIASKAGIWCNPNGSLHLAYHQDEWDTLNEFMALYKDEAYEARLLDPGETQVHSPMSNPQGLKGSLWSETECTVNPREAIRQLPLWMAETKGLTIRFGHVVKGINMPYLETNRERWKVDKIIVCSGADFQTLYPEFFDKQPLTKCKLQMMKGLPSERFNLGPSLCAGLTLRHYASFTHCPSLSKVSARYDHENLEFKKHGIHVLVSQNNHGELIIGDSHHYGGSVEPFDHEYINEIILNYLRTFFRMEGLTITERWHGVYPKLEGKGLRLVDEVEPDVIVVNGFGGAGMTLSFGVAEQVVNVM